MKSLSISGKNFWLTPMENRGVILTPIDQKANPAIIAQRIQENLQSGKLNFVQEVIATSEEIFIASSNTKKAIKEISALRFKKSSIKKWKVPVLFNDNRDWNYVSEQTGISKVTYISQLVNLSLSVQMMGFLPGFVYVDGLTKEMQVPRKETPVSNPIPNVLAVGGPYIGIYSLPSPSGWHILGRIPLEILSLNGAIPLSFKIGDQLELESISESDFSKLDSQHLNLISYNV